MEQWKLIPGYNNRYSINKNGEVRSFKGTSYKILKDSNGKNPYNAIRLYDKGVGKKFAIHVLVAIVYLDHIPSENKLVVNHIDFNKRNNCVSNLEIVSHRQNTNRKHLKSSSQFTGVHFDKENNKWRACIDIYGKHKYLGRFLTEEEASNAYKEKLKIITEID